MARPTNTNKGKESLINIGVKVVLALKNAIEVEGAALGVAPGTYARQLLTIGWQSRHQAPIAKNPREQILTGLFNELPLGEQENVLAIVETLHKKHAQEKIRLPNSENNLPVSRPLPTEPRPHYPTGPYIRDRKKGGKK